MKGFNPTPRLSDRLKRRLIKVLDRFDVNQDEELIQRWILSAAKELGEPDFIRWTDCKDADLGRELANRLNQVCISIAPPEAKAQMNKMAREGITELWAGEGFIPGEDFSFAENGGMFIGDRLYQHLKTNEPGLIEQLEQSQGITRGQAKPNTLYHHIEASQKALGVPWFERACKRYKMLRKYYRDAKVLCSLWHLMDGIEGRFMRQDLEVSKYLWSALKCGFTREQFHEFCSNADMLPEYNFEDESGTELHPWQILCFGLEPIAESPLSSSDGKGLSIEALKLMGQVWQPTDSKYSLLEVANAVEGQTK